MKPDTNVAFYSSAVLISERQHSVYYVSNLDVSDFKESISMRYGFDHPYQGLFLLAVPMILLREQN